MEAINVKYYKHILTDCFSTDEELLQKWHIKSNCGLDRCVDRTHNDLKKWNVEVYKLIKNNELVGYFGIENNESLTGFFIKPRFRNKEVIQEFWNIVDNKFNKTYTIGIFSKNEPAKKFLLKKTDIYFEYNDTLLFVVNKGV